MIQYNTIQKQGVQNYPELAVTFLKNPLEKMIFESMRGRYEKVSFLIFRTKFTRNEKVRNKTFQVNLTKIKHSLKRFIKKKPESLLLIFLAL